MWLMHGRCQTWWLQQPPLGSRPRARLSTALDLQGYLAPVFSMWFGCMPVFGTHVRMLQGGKLLGSVCDALANEMSNRGQVFGHQMLGTRKMR